MIKKIIIGVVVVVLLYFLYVWIFGDSSRSYILGMQDAKKKKIIDGSYFPKGGSADYTYSMWVYVSNWNYRIGEKKMIISRNNSDGNPAPYISLGANVNNIDVTLATYSDSGNSQLHTCTLDNIPLQTWVNVIVTLNNRALDLYLDGKLVRTCVLPGVPKQSTGQPLIVSNSPKDSNSGGFDGFISNVTYLARPVNPREAYSLYREGPGSSNWFTNIFNKYRLKFSFMKDNREVNSFEI